MADKRGGIPEAGSSGRREGSIGRRSLELLDGGDRAGCRGYPEAESPEGESPMLPFLLSLLDLFEVFIDELLA